MAQIERDTLPCLECEGTGIVKKYLNMAGDYLKFHCRACGGTGKQYYGGPTYQPITNQGGS